LTLAWLTRTVRRLAVVGVTLLSLGLLPHTADAGPGTLAQYTSALDNGVIRVGIDANAGGVISYVSPSGSSTNLINTYDLGREVQQSYYAGEKIDRLAEGQSPIWSPWTWNPIGAGDTFGNPAIVQELEITPTTLYVNVRPLLWDMDNAACECYMRTWITLEGGRVRVHNRLTVHRTDSRWGAVSRAQELPAAYPIADLSRIVSYTGPAPFKWGAVSEIPLSDASDNWVTDWVTGEHWGACVNESNFGVGVYTPGRRRVLGGIYGRPGGDTHSLNSCYIAPAELTALDRTTRFDYDYWLAVGTVDQIRQQFYAARQTIGSPPAGFPAGDAQVWGFNADGDFGGWRPAHGISTTTVTSGRLEGRATNGDPYLHSPELGKPARNWNITVRLRNGTPSSTAQLFFTTTADKSWSSSKSKRIAIAPNSSFREYTFDMSDVSTWRGTIFGLRLDPAEAAGSFAIDWIRVGRG
jgi:hypothetical protein